MSFFSFALGFIIFASIFPFVFFSRTIMSLYKEDALLIM